MLINLGRNLLRHVNRRIICKSTNRALCCHRSYFLSNLTDHSVPNLNRLPCNLIIPCNYSTAAVQTKESLKVDKNQHRNGIGDYYRRSLEDDQNYQACLFSLEIVKNETKNSDNKVLLASRELLKDFEESISSINEERIAYLKKLINNKETTLTYYELAEAIDNIAHCMVEDQDKGETFHDQLFELVKLLDKECVNQIHNFSVDQKIFMADLWCRYHKVAFSLKETNFVFKVMWKLFDWTKTLNKSQMAMFFYFISITKYAPNTNNDFKSYVQVEKMLPLFSIEEIGLICHAYVVVQRYPITENGVNCIVSRLSQDMHSCSLTSLKFITKFLSRILPFEDTSMYSVQKTVASNSDELPIRALIDLLYVTAYRLLDADKSLLETTLKRVKENFQEVSFLYLCKLLDILSIINIHDEELLQLAAEQIRTKKFLQSPNYVGVLKRLIIFNVYLEDIISEVLNENFCKECNKLQKLPIWSDLCFIEMSMSIEKPHADFPRLPEKKKIRFIKQTRFKQGDSKKYQIRSCGFVLEECLARIYGTDKCYVYTSVIPHFYAHSTVLKLDKNLRGQEIPVSWKAGDDFKRPADNDHYWVVLYLLKAMFFNRGGNLNAIAECMNRQMRSLGFVPIPIYMKDFLQSEEKDKFLEKRITETIQNISDNKK